jgi:hypothetical protein
MHATKEYGGVKIYLHLFYTKKWGGGWMLSSIIRTAKGVFIKDPDPVWSL